ncbi:hypothetical protein CWS72_19205 [Telmatospirillum siberiense]|uniref:Uncharacterized protein n=1 Tax=Telmatospirillum siberiense TaxID=382514 RepID=A0A2N3PRF3_9PROT|nr:hypothetical protein CWS72_19205 [Telmatospirillum siberiense]
MISRLELSKKDVFDTTSTHLSGHDRPEPILVTERRAENNVVHILNFETGHEAVPDICRTCADVHSQSFSFLPH